MTETTLCYITHDGCALMLHRTKKAHDDNAGKWVGVGGHIEPGETPLECALRETREETGLTLLDARPRGVVRFRNDLYADEDMYLFTATRFEGTLIPCDEGELRWVPLDEVLSLNLWEGDRLFLRLLREGANGFELSLYYHGDALERAVLDGAPVNLNGEDG